MVLPGAGLSQVRGRTGYVCDANAARNFLGWPASAEGPSSGVWAARRGGRPAEIRRMAFARHGREIALGIVAGAKPAAGPAGGGCLIGHRPFR